MFSKAPLIKFKWKKYSANSEIAALLIHGGCFTEGDETWNSDQAQAISSKCNLDVFTIDFSKKSFTESKENIKKFYMLLRETYKERVGLIGCSSGGFLVLNLMDEIIEPLFSTLICPVMDPEKREDMLLEMGSKQHAKIHGQQLQYFQNKPYPTAKTNKLPFNIIAASDDENVPLSLIESEARRFPGAAIHAIKGTHAISYKPSEDAIDIISELVKLARQHCMATI